MTPDPSPKPARPLPKSRAILETMFKHCDLCIARAKTARHRSRQKIQLVSEFADHKCGWEQVAKRLKNIDEAHQRDRDTTITEIEELWPYCEAELIDAATEYLSKAELAVIGGIEIKDECSANEFVQATIALGLGQKHHLLALQRLRQRVFDALEVLIRQTRKDGLIFHGPRGGRLKPDTVRNVLVSKVINVLAPKFPSAHGAKGFATGRLHSFRHYFYSRCANSGVPERMIMEWLGHKDSEMVRHYYHMCDTEARRHMEGLDLLGSAGKRVTG